MNLFFALSAPFKRIDRHQFQLGVWRLFPPQNPEMSSQKSQGTIYREPGGSKMFPAAKFPFESTTKAPQKGLIMSLIIFLSRKRGGFYSHSNNAAILEKGISLSRLSFWNGSLRLEIHSSSPVWFSSLVNEGFHRDVRRANGRLPLAISGTQRWYRQTVPAVKLA